MSRVVSVASRGFGIGHGSESQYAAGAWTDDQLFLLESDTAFVEQNSDFAIDVGKAVEATRLGYQAR
jgi:hypothetical protein